MPRLTGKTVVVQATSLSSSYRSHVFTEARVIKVGGVFHSFLPFLCVFEFECSVYSIVGTALPALETQ